MLRPLSCVRRECAETAHTINYKISPIDAVFKLPGHLPAQKIALFPLWVDDFGFLLRRKLHSACPRSTRPVGSAPPGTPCGRGGMAPAPASDGCAVLAWVDYGVLHYMATVASSVVGNANNAYFFCPMRLPSLDCGRLFSAKIAFRDAPFTQLYAGDFAEPFPPPLRTLFWARRSALGRAPQGVTHPLTRGRARPAPARLRLLWRSRASASGAMMLKQQTASSTSLGKSAPHMPRRCPMFRMIFVPGLHVRNNRRRQT